MWTSLSIARITSRASASDAAPLVQVPWLSLGAAEIRTTAPGLFNCVCLHCAEWFEPVQASAQEQEVFALSHHTVVIGPE